MLTNESYADCLANSTAAPTGTTYAGNWTPPTITYVYPNWFVEEQLTKGQVVAIALSVMVFTIVAR